MKSARAVGAGGAGGARTARGAPALSADEPAWLARLGAGFAGLVVDEWDQPLAGALVVALVACAHDPARPDGVSAVSLAAPRASGSWFVATTEADGRFALPVLPPGRYTLFALHIGPPPAVSEVVVVEGGFLSVPLRLVISRETPLL